MADLLSETHELIDRAGLGDEAARQNLLERYWDYLPLVRWSKAFPVSRRHLAFLGLVLTGLFGCESNPTGVLQSPLPAGAEAMTFYDTSYGVPAEDDHLKQYRVRIELGGDCGPYGRDYDHVPLGTKVRVIEDTPGPDNDGKRMVKVTLLDGAYTGKTAEIRREKIRPLLN
jgi:hypothetical protein